MATLPDVSAARQAELLDGAVDFHVHTAPDTTPRYAIDLDVAREAREAGMRAVVVKSHIVPTAGRVDVTNRELDFEDPALYGGVTLNGSAGGVNPAAVEVALDLGGKIVWLPTVWSENHAAQAREAGVERFAGVRVPDPDEDVPVVVDGELTPAAREVVELVAEADAVLGTGHLSAEEAIVVAEACADAGADCLVNHALFRVVDASTEQLARLVELGATIECCAYAHVEEGTPPTTDRIADAVDRFGPGSVLLATDFGQVGNPPAPGLARFAEAVCAAGVDEADVRRMLTETPADLLGI